MNSTRKTALVGAAVASAVVGISGVGGAVSGARAAPVNKPPLDEKTVSPVGDPLAAAASAYRIAYPQISRHRAERAAAQQDVRKALQVEITTGGGARTFAGAWFNAPRGVVHVAATTPVARRHARETAEQLGLRIKTHAATRSFAQLETAAAALRAGNGRLAALAAGHVGINVKTNQVVAAIPPRKLAGLRLAPGAGVRVVPRRHLDVVPDAGCTARNACDYTIRG